MGLGSAILGFLNYLDAGKDRESAAKSRALQDKATQQELDQRRTLFEQGQGKHERDLADELMARKMGLPQVKLDMELAQGDAALGEAKAKSGARNAAPLVSDLQFNAAQGFPIVSIPQKISADQAPDSTGQYPERGTQLFSELPRGGQAAALAEARKGYPKATLADVSAMWNPNQAAISAPRVQKPQIVGEPDAKLNASAITTKPGELPQATFTQKEAVPVQDVPDPRDPNKSLGTMVGNNWVPNKSSVPMTEVQHGAFSYGSRLVFNDGLFNRLASAPGAAKTEQLGTGYLAKLAPNALLGANLQGQLAAKANFVAALLRKESGAAISKKEYDDGNAQYFPQPGEGPQLIAQKAALRQLATRNMLSGAGINAPEAVESAQKALEILYGKPDAAGGAGGTGVGAATGAPQSFAEKIAAGFVPNADGTWTPPGAAAPAPASPASPVMAIPGYDPSAPRPPMTPEPPPAEAPIQTVPINWQQWRKRGYSPPPAENIMLPNLPGGIVFPRR